MRTINTSAVSEKGALKPAVRTAVNEKVLPEVAEVLADLGFEYFADKKAFALPMRDSSGNTIYFTLTSTVGLKSPAEKAEKKHSAPKAKAETPVVEILED